MDDILIKSLQKFLTENKRSRIENDGCACWTEVLSSLPYFEGKRPRISVVFTRYQGKDVNKTVLMADATHSIGMVLAVPSYWLEVDQYLTQVYISNYVDGFINDNYSGSSGSSGSSDVDDSWIHEGPTPIPPPTIPTKCPVTGDTPPTPGPFIPPVPPMTPPRPVFNTPQTAGHGVVDQNISDFNKL